MHIKVSTHLLYYIYYRYNINYKIMVEIKISIFYNKIKTKF